VTENVPAVPEQGADSPGGELIATRKGMFGARNGGDTSGYGGLVRRIELPGGRLCSSSAPSSSSATTSK